MHIIVGEKRKPNPAGNANPLSQLCFFYMLPIFKKTYKKEMTEDDVFEPLPEHMSSIIGDKSEIIWKEEYLNPKHRKRALHRALLRLFGFRFVLYGVIKGIEQCFMVIMLPISIQKVVSYFQEKKISKDEVLMYSGFISFTFLLNAFTTHPTFMGLAHICMKMRVACCSLIYRKSLRLNRTSLSRTTVGQIINLLSNDVSKFDEGFILFHFIWIAPVQTFFGVYLIYREIQISAFFGIAFLLAIFPLQIWAGNKTSTLRLKTAIRTDERVRLMNEIIIGIQVIKMYCWEQSFAKLIHHARKREMKTIRIHAYLIGILYAFEMFITRTSIFISILSFVLFGNIISADKVFVITGIYNIIRPIITMLFSISVSSIAEVDISVSRINTFLCHDEILKDEPSEELETTRSNTENGENDDADLQKMSPSNSLDEQNDNEHEQIKIRLDKIDAVWIADSEEKDLIDLNLDIVGNQLVAVIGPVGSGKSSLINLLLKEMTIVAGNMEIRGKISYASQEPWLFSGSIRQNILFGEEYDRLRYNSIIKVCALEHDLQLFPYGDKTLVGERGKILSGGQKARINLARCVYKNADIYLLDDPLSAVDVNVGKHLYFQCIDRYLSDKICILVTHQLQYLYTADRILIMENGTIKQTGTYDQLQSGGLDFAKLLEKSEDDGMDIDVKRRRSRQLSVQSFIQDIDYDIQFEDEEKMGHGKIKMKTYLDYFRSGGNILQIGLLITIYVFGYIIMFGGDFYVTHWVNLEQDFAMSNHKNNTDVPFSRNNILYTYSAIILGTIVLSLTKAIFFMDFLTKAARNLHDSTFNRLINATMQFFNTNPSGRILNRFSEDMGRVDEYIPLILYDVVTIGLLYIFVVILASMVQFLMLPSSILLAALFITLRSIYLRTSRNVKRIVSITKSPMYSHITATLQGLTTIRAFNADKILINEFDYFQDRNSSAHYLFLASSQCFGFWINFLCVCFISVATFALVMFDENLHGGDMGLVITQYIGLLASLDWGMRQWSELENQMTSTERILEYKSIATEPERPLVIDLPRNWPTEGRLQFENISLKYNETDPYVLKNISFTVEPGEKIGIVGRTGAGKSSIITSLFQLYPSEGSIIIDGIDTNQIPLNEVRNKISIIPQEPVLFSGSMRKNLDPFEEYDDELLWNALEQVELKETVQEMPHGLNAEVTEGGSNFSVGERQLVCLARALIRQNKILVLDEATANVDPYTDSLIQRTIRTKFNDCSVLTVAHRLNTVMDSDKILVMQNGIVEEFDHPHILLQNNSGLLRRLIEATGETTSKQLQQIARQNFEKRSRTT